MGIFTFGRECSIGQVVRVETARVWVRVPSPERLKEARVGRLLAIMGGDANEWLVGIVERVWRRPIDVAPPDPAVEETPALDEDTSVVQEENGVQLVLIGTYRAREGKTRDKFTRAVLTLPTIDEPVYPIEDTALESFMRIISTESAATEGAALAIGTFTLDEKATAFVDGNRLFQRHAALIGSTGTGKSCAVASLLERAAELPHANVVLFDLHGEYRNLPYARHLRIAGPGDLAVPPENAVFLPYWLLNYEEMQAVFIDRSEQSAHNQAMFFHDAVYAAKRTSLEEEKRQDVLESFTIDSPVPFDLGGVVDVIDDKNTEKVPGAQGREKQGDFYGHFSRFLIRLRSKLADRRYGFMFQPPDRWMRYDALHHLAELLLGHGKQGEVSEGVKVVDFSEVPSDVLPIVVSLVARLVFQVQFWAETDDSGNGRHPVLLVCDEAHLYLPSLRAEAGPMQRRALDNFERIAKEGRKYGVGLLVVSQRPADISTTILSQCNNFISLRLSNGDDQSVVRQMMPESLAGLLEILPTLDIGEAVVVGDAILLPARVRLFRPTVEPRSATVSFWTCWGKPDSPSALAVAVENMRRQARSTA